MAGNFTSPSATPKMHVGKANRPKRTSEASIGIKNKPEYPLTDSFASKTIPGFSSRHAKTNGKTGFYTCPAKPPAGRLAQRPKAPNRGSGKVL